MSTYAESYTDPSAEEDISYRAISRPAIVSLILGLVGAAGFMFPMLLAPAFVGLVLAVAALISIRRYPQELSGAPFAVVGMILCSLILFGGSAMHTYIYFTEVPDGFERMTFYELKPDSNNPTVAVSQRAMELDMQNVFVKGYVHPGVSGLGPVDSFVLVGDMKTCCFGGQPKLTDMIEVKLTHGQRVQYSTRKRKLAGVFKVSRMKKPKVAGGISGGFYQLEANYAK